MAWEVDPDFVLQSRLTFGRSVVKASVVTAAVAWAVAGRSQDFGELVSWASRFLFAVPLPYAAVEALELHRTGQMDLRRLTGRPPAALGAALMAGTALLPLVLGLVLYAASVRAGTAAAPLTMLAILAVGAAVALVLLAVPALSKPNRWIVVTFIVLAAGTACALVNDSRPYALTAIVVSTAVLVATSHPASQWFRRPPRAAIHPRRSRRAAIDLSHTRFAEFARLRLMTRIPGAWLTISLAAVAAAMTANLRWSSDYTREMFSLMIVYVPLIIGAYDTSERARVERASGGLDRLKLTGEGAENATLQMVVAAALPFIVISAAAVVTLAVLTPGDLAKVMAAWPLTVVLWMFAGAAEGFRGRKPGAYLAIAVALAAALVPWNARGSWLPLCCTAALAGPTAFGSLKWTDDAPFPGWRAFLVAPLLTLIVVAVSLSNDETAPIVTTGLLSVASGLMLPDRRSLRTATIAGVATVVAIAAAIATDAWSAEWAGFSPRVHAYVSKTSMFFARGGGSRGTFIALIAASAALGWIYGCMAHREFGATSARSGVARAAPLLLTLWPGHSYETHMANQQFMMRTGHDGFAVAQILLLGLMAGVTTVLTRRAWRAGVRGNGTSTRTSRSRPT